MPAQNTEVSASTEPTERSIPPVKITPVIPKAIKPLTDDCFKSESKLLIFLKSGLTTLNTINRKIRAISEPKS